MPQPRKKIASGPPLGGLSCGYGLVWFPLHRCVWPWLVSIRPGDPIFFRRFPPMGEFVPWPRKKIVRGPPQGGGHAVTVCCVCPCAGAPNPDWCTSALATQSFARGSPLWNNLCSGLRNKIARGPPLEGMSCGYGFCGFPWSGAPNPDQFPSAPATQIFQGFPPMEEFMPQPWKKNIYGSPPKGDFVRWQVAVVAPAQVRPTLIGVYPPWRSKHFPVVPPYGRIHALASEKKSRVPPLGGMPCSDGFLWLPLRRCPQPWSVSILPGEMSVPAAAQILVGVPP